MRSFALCVADLETRVMKLRVITLFVLIVGVEN